MEVQSYREPTITVEKLRAFMDSVKIGDVFRLHFLQGYRNGADIPRPTRARVLQKYPFIVRTDVGDFQWLDLYLGKKIG